MLSKNLCQVTGRVWVGCRLGTGQKIPTCTHTRSAPIPTTLSGDPNLCSCLLARHHYTTPMSYSTISHPHNPTQNTTRPRLNKHSRTQVTTVLAQARVPPTRLLEFSLRGADGSVVIASKPGLLSQRRPISSAVAGSIPAENHQGVLVGIACQPSPTVLRVSLV